VAPSPRAIQMPSSIIVAEERDKLHTSAHALSFNKELIELNGRIKAVYQQKNDKKLVIGIVESKPYHQEVYSSVIYNLYKIFPGVIIKCFVPLEATMKIEQILNSFNQDNKIDMKEFELLDYKLFSLVYSTQANYFSGLIFPTIFDGFMCEMSELLIKYEATSQIPEIFLIIHSALEPVDIINALNLTWLNNSRIMQKVHLLTLADQVTRAVEQLHKISKSLLLHCSVNTFYPLFPYKGAASYLSSSFDAENYSVRSGFAVQGYVEVQKRNWNQLFSDMNSAKESKEPPCIQLHIVGRYVNNHNIQEIPSELFISETSDQTGIILHENLPFSQYYSVLAERVAICCNFPENDAEGYMSHKTSSTIGASLITQTPVLISPSALRVYSFLNKTAVWLKISDEETEVDAMRRILAMKQARLEAEIKEKLKALRQLTLELFHRNQSFFRQLLPNFS
jgi:hypothetical protein